MCIICNCGNDGCVFLGHFGRAQASMKLATESMLSCSITAQDENVKKQYDATHKKMARILKDWNKIEEFREKINVPQVDK